MGREAQESVRLDKWLWAARLFKTRAVAVEAIDGGRVRVNGARAKRARPVRPGDEIRLRKGSFEYRLTVRGLSERRGPAAEAAALYEEDPAGRDARERLAAQMRALPTAFHEGKGHPSKKQRRQIERFKRTLGIAALLTATALPAQAQTLAPGDSLPPDSAAITGVLPNGLRYIVRANHRPEHRAELRLVVDAGSILEDDDQRGLAHFVEHMAFDGTTHFPHQAITNYLESVGMRLGPDLNAFTSYDQTIYMLQIPTDTAAVVARAFDILADWAHAVTFDSTEFNRERNVVIEEWRLGRGAGARIRDQQFPILFHGSRYADRLVIGTKESLERATRAELQRFYRDWYRPDLESVVAVGDFDPATIVTLIREKFGALREAAHPRPRPTYPVPGNDTTLFAIASDSELTIANVSVVYKQSLRDHATVEAYREGLVEDLYNGMLNERLGELAQRADPPFIGAGSGQGRFVRSDEIYNLGAAVNDSGIVRGLRALLTEAQRVKQYGFTASELAREKAELLRGMQQRYDERDKTNSNVYVNAYVNHLLTGDPIPGIATAYRLDQRFLPAIRLADVNRLASAWITDTNRVVLVSVPRKPGVPIPTEADLRAVFDHVASARITPYVDSASAAPLVPVPPQPGRIVKETHPDSLGVIRWRLANGALVVLKPTDFKDDEILFRATSPGGTSLAPDSDYVSAAFAATVADISGVGAFDAVDLQKKLAGKVVNVSPTISEMDEGMVGRSSKSDLKTLFQLIYLYFTAPRADSGTFASFRTRFGAIIANRARSPQAAFQDTLEVTLHQHAFRDRPLSPAILNELDRRRAYAFYRDRFADAGDFAFIFVGSFTPDSIRPLVERYLGGLPTTHRTESWRDVEPPLPPGVVVRSVRRGAEPKSSTAIVFGGPFMDNTVTRLELDALGDALQLRLRDVLRQELGGTYSVGVFSSISRYPPQRYSLQIRFGAAPARLDSLVETVFAEIAKFQHNGPTAEEVEKVQEADRRTHEANLRENGYWIGRLEADAKYGLEPGFTLSFDQRVDSLTAVTLRDAAKHYLTTDHYVRVSLYPAKTP